MKTILALVLFLAGIADAAISAATKPHTIDSAVTPKVSYVDDNDEALLDKLNEVIDTANIYLGGGVSAAVLSTTGDQRLTIDSDNNGSNRWFVTSGGTSDTLLRILEGGTWATYGAGVGTKLTLSDSILAATARISGNGYFGGTLTAVGATSLAGLSATTGAFSSNATVGGTLGVTGASTIAALSATTGSFSSTLGVTGLQTNSEAIAFGATGTSGSGRIWRSAGGGLSLRGVAGSSNDVQILSTGSGDLFTNPTGTNNVVIAGSGGVTSVGGRLNVGGATDNSSFFLNVSGGSIGLSGANSILGYGSGVPGDANYERISLIHTGSAAELRSQAGGTGTVEPLRLVVGSTTRYEITNAGAHAITGAATFSTDFTQSDGTHTVSVTDNTANAVDIQQGANNYINVNTTNSSENVSFGNASTNPSYSFLGTGTVTATGKLGTADSLFAEDGIRVGAVSASNVNWNRSGANMWNTPDSVTVSGKIIGSDTVVATLGIRTGGGEAFVYGDTSFTITANSGWTTTPSGTAYATRIGRSVTLHIPYLDGVSNSTGAGLSGIPTGWRPARNANVGLYPCFDNSAGDQRYGCHLLVNTLGEVGLLFSGTSSGNFTASGNKGLGDVTTTSGVTITYQLQ